MDLLAIRNAPEAVAAATADIREVLLGGSSCVREADFRQIGEEDLARLFALYDERFFGGWLARTVKEKAAVPLRLRLSTTMTRAGGKTIRKCWRSPDGVRRETYEIAIASRMLFMTFGRVDRPVTVCGRVCADRLSALQRILEHEILHLAELLAWGKSSCAGRRFKLLAANLFAHTDNKHALVTPREAAAVEHGLVVGSLVEFDFRGRRYAGRINRIHRRATVLVEDPDGRRYSDGKHYTGFYVPLQVLRPLPPPAAPPKAAGA